MFKNMFHFMFLLFPMFVLGKSIEYTGYTGYTKYTEYSEIYLSDTLKIYASCDKVIQNYNMNICYNYDLKEPLFNLYIIDKRVSEKIKKRMQFKRDKRIPIQYDNNLKCYVKSGYDRGHLAPDADFDYDKLVLSKTYLNTNIVPQLPYVNRRLISKIEKEERKEALLNENSFLIIITGIVKPINKLHLKNNNNCPVIPKKYFKLFITYNGKYKIEKLYIIENKKINEIIDKVLIYQFLNKINIKIIKTTEGGSDVLFN